MSVPASHELPRLAALPLDDAATSASQVRGALLSGDINLPANGLTYTARAQAKLLEEHLLQREPNHSIHLNLASIARGVAVVLDYYGRRSGQSNKYFPNNFLYAVGLCVRNDAYHFSQENVSNPEQVALCHPFSTYTDLLAHYTHDPSVKSEHVRQALSLKPLDPHAVIQDKNSFIAEHEAGRNAPASPITPQQRRLLLPRRRSFMHQTAPKEAYTITGDTLADLNRIRAANRLGLELPYAEIQEIDDDALRLLLEEVRLAVSYAPEAYESVLTMDMHDAAIFIMKGIVRYNGHHSEEDWIPRGVISHSKLVVAHLRTVAELQKYGISAADELAKWYSPQQIRRLTAVRFGVAYDHPLFPYARLDTSWAHRSEQDILPPNSKTSALILRQRSSGLGLSRVKTINNEVLEAGMEPAIAVRILRKAIGTKHVTLTPLKAEAQNIIDTCATHIETTLHGIQGSENIDVQDAAKRIAYILWRHINKSGGDLGIYYDKEFYRDVSSYIAPDMIGFAAEDIKHPVRAGIHQPYSIYSELVGTYADNPNVSATLIRRYISRYPWNPQERIEKYIARIEGCRTGIPEFSDETIWQKYRERVALLARDANPETFTGLVRHLMTTGWPIDISKLRMGGVAKAKKI